MNGYWSRTSKRLWRPGGSFMRLTRAQPCGQMMWLHLLTGPHSRQLPGISQAGIAVLAEGLEWSLEDTRTYLAEVVDAGMAIFDHDNRVLYLPRWHQHHPQPSNLNVLKSWASAFADLPDCTAKAMWWGDLQRQCHQRGKSPRIDWPAQFKSMFPAVQLLRIDSQD